MYLIYKQSQITPVECTNVIGRRKFSSIKHTHHTATIILSIKLQTVVIIKQSDLLLATNMHNDV